MDRKVKSSGRDILGYFLLGVSVILLGRSLMLCFSNDIWYDELFTVGMIKYSYRELVDLTARDVHPPLYYMIVKLFVDLCKLVWPEVSAVAVAKMVSVLPYFGLLFYSVAMVRKRFSMFAGGLFLFCSIAMPQLSSYTVEVRMYSWALLFVTAAFLHGNAAVSVLDADENEEKKAHRAVGIQKLHGAAMVCYGVAAAYTQYFAAVAVGMVYLYVLFVLLRRDRSRILEWISWMVASAAGYAAWMVVLYRQITVVNNNYWILPLSWRTLGGCVKFLMKPAFTNAVLNVVLAVVMTGIYAVVIVSTIVPAIKLFHNSREKEKSRSGHGQESEEVSDGEADGKKTQAVRARAEFVAAGVFVLAGLVLFGFAASLLIRPIFVYRYMVPAMGCFWLSFAVGLDGLWKTGRGSVCGKQSFFRLLPVAAVVLIVVVGLRDYRAFMGEEEYKILWMEQAQEALSSIAPGDIAVYNFDQVQAVTAYYLPEEVESYLWCGTPEVLIQDIVRPFDVLEETKTLRRWCEDGRTVWFIGSFNSRDDIVKEWEADGLQIKETGSYLLERYWFNLYKISI